MNKAFLVAVGSELLLPGREDTNTIFLRERLFDLGIPVEGSAVVGDQETTLAQILESAAHRAGLVIVTGGLGPTEDDITKKTLARLLKKSLRYDENVKNRLESFFATRGLKMPENNLRQALVPAGSKTIENRVGTAPGILMEDHGCLFILLPGPPKEMQPMFNTQVAPLLKKKFGERKIHQRRLRLTGIPESVADQTAAVIYKKYKEIETTILSKPGDIELIMTLREGMATVDLLDRLAEELSQALGHCLYSTTGEPLEIVLGKLLQERRATLSVAESCTGGLLAERLTSVPGSSAYFLGGVVCYSNESKTRLVDVPADLLRRQGAVSSAVAAAMAAGVRKRTSSRHSLSITGIAGPEGGTPDKPVGVVYIGASIDEKMVVKKFQFHGDRERIRFQSTQMAMEVLRRSLVEEGGKP